MSEKNKMILPQNDRLDSVRRSFDRADLSYDGHAVIQKYMGSELCKLLRDSIVGKNFAAELKERDLCRTASSYANTLFLNEDTDNGAASALKHSFCAFSPLRENTAAEDINAAHTEAFDLSCFKDCFASDRYAPADLKTKVQLFASVCKTPYPYSELPVSSDKDKVKKAAADLSFDDMLYLRQRRVLEIGCGPGSFSKTAALLLQPAHFFVNDISEKMTERCMHSLREAFPKAAESGVIRPLTGNALSLNYSHTEGVPDIIVSNAVFQWFPCLKSALGKIRLSFCSEQSGTLLAFSSFAEGHFKELASLSDRVLACPSLRQVREDLESECSDFELYECCIRQYFASAADLFRHMQRTGVSALEGEKMSAGSLRSLMRLYESKFSDDEGVYISWRPYFAVCRIQKDGRD